MEVSLPEPAFEVVVVRRRSQYILFSSRFEVVSSSGDERQSNTEAFEHTAAAEHFHAARPL